MSEPRLLLNIGLGIIDTEMQRLKRASGRTTEEGEPAGLLMAERDDLCAYMNVLHKLVGKDLGGDENYSEMSQEELDKEYEKYIAERGLGPSHAKDKRRGRGKAPVDGSGG